MIAATSNQRYRTIVADPPWDMGATGHPRGRGKWRQHAQFDNETRETSPPYPTLTVAEISALPINQLAAPNAHLFLWTTNRYLERSFGVARAWGFSPRQTILWCKAPLGVPVGGTFSSTVEFALFCRRGNLPALRRVDRQWFEWPRRKGPPVKLGEKRSSGHSAKPEAFLDLVESVSPSPYLELFARRQRLGWDTWGDEALRHVDMEATA